jgi:PAS domain-containing protein/GNAT superfamily N-acetyltransferase
MIPHYLFDNTQPPRRNRFWILTGLTVLVTLVNLIALGQGISIVFSHFFYLPIILTGYWYPRRGVVFSTCVAMAYAAMALTVGPQESLLGITVMSRCIIFIMIGAVVSYLSSSLRVSEQQLHEIIEFLPDPTFAVDREGRVIAWNRAIEDLTGTRKEEMLGRGEHAYAIPFYGERRPVLVDLILHPDEQAEGLYPEIKKEEKTYSAEVFIPHFHERKGAHLRISATALADVDGNITGGIEVIRDITGQVMLQSALQTTGSRLNILAGIVRNDIAKKLAVMYGHLSIGVMKFNDPEVLTFIGNIQESANAIQRQIEISREFRDIGTTPPVWVPVLQASSAAADRIDFKDLIFRSWTARLEIFTDPHIPTVFFHIFENSRKEGKGADRVLVTYHIHSKGCTIIIEDNGKGIPDAAKGSLFTQRNETYGCGLFLAHEILILTGVGIRETGTAGKGIRFEILVPPEGYRIKGTGGVPAAKEGDGRPVSGYAMAADLSGTPEGTAPRVRELMADEFVLADEVWREYHETQGDPAMDRIFAVFLGDVVVSLARCRRHTDGMEVDGIFTPAGYRGKGYSHRAVSALVEACHNDDLFMHAVRHLVPFYQPFGFENIAERDLPPTIRERYVWAAGNLEGADVQPMRRKAGL